jgi:hypothetical protein
MNAVVKPIPGSDYIVADMARDAAWGRKEILIAETEMPGLVAIREESPDAAAQGRAHFWLPAHDHPDRGAHRDAAGARRAAGLVQHLLRRIMQRRRLPNAARRCWWKGESLVDY